MQQTPQSTGDFVPVRYIGFREYHADTLYGTGIQWAKGQTQLVPAGKVAALLRHADVYELDLESSEIVRPSVNAAAEKALAAKKQEVQEAEKVEDLRDSIANMPKDALEKFAKAHFNIDVDKRKSAEVLRAQVTGLIDQFGIE